MSLDGIFLNSITNELYKKIIGGKVDKIYQPDKNEIVLSVRNKGENLKLLMTAISNSPKLQITNMTRKNPQQPPMFCMLLRKHLTGSRIINIKQINFDRIVEITFECKDELDSDVNKSLIIEIMGKHSNIIFINENNTIIDSVKRITENISSVRQIYPGLEYVFPPGTDKKNPLELSKEIFFNEINSLNEGMFVFDFLYKRFTGISPFISREICYLANLNESTHLGELDNFKKQKFWDAFHEVMIKVRNGDFSYNIYYDNNENYYDFYCLDVEYLKHLNKKNFDSPGELLDEYYFEFDNKNKINQKAASIVKRISTKIDRDLKKVEKQRNELLNTEDREKYRIYGELILANLHKTPENHKLTVINYYDTEQKEITIPLDPKFNLPLNSQKYFKRYNKLKKAEEELKIQIDSTIEEVTYYENVLYSIETCTTAEDLNHIYDELYEAGFLKKKPDVKKSKEQMKITTYVSSKGHDILVGKNNLQNEFITFKLAKKEDYWFHVKNMPGSHVVIKTNGDELTDEEYVEAAQIAAYYSKGKNSNSVEVDYTKKTNIKKPISQKPGFVIYDTNYSMIVSPNIDRIKTKN